MKRPVILAVDDEPAVAAAITRDLRPSIDSADDALRGRFHIVPFDRVFAGDAADRTLDDKLREEWPGILTWMLAGCLDWQRNGLVVPDKVRDATTAYFERQDTFEQWLAEDTSLGPNLTDTAARLYKSWKQFAEAAGESPGSKKALSEKLRRAGFKPGKSRDDGGQSSRTWTGLKAVMQ